MFHNRTELPFHGVYAHLQNWYVFDELEVRQHVSARYSCDTKSQGDHLHAQNTLKNLFRVQPEEKNVRLIDLFFPPLRSRGKEGECNDSDVPYFLYWLHSSILLFPLIVRVFFL